MHQNGSLADGLSNHVQPQDARDKCLLAHGRPVIPIERELIVHDPAQRQFIAAEFGRDICIFNRKNCLSVRRRILRGSRGCDRPST